MREQDMEYKVNMDMLMRNENNHFTPTGYQRMVMDVIERHFAWGGADESALLAKGVSWVMLSMTVEIKDKITSTEHLTAKTWLSEKNGFIYRRETAFYHEDGTLAFSGATFFAMIDVAKRRICRNPENYVPEPESYGDMLIEAQSRIKWEAVPMDKTEKISVRPSWLDAVGHVNNIRYFEIAYDALSDEEREKMDRLKRFEMYFIGELHKGESAEVASLAIGDQTVVVGTREDGKTSFIEKVYFS